MESSLDQPERRFLLHQRPFDFSSHISLRILCTRSPTCAQRKLRTTRPYPCCPKRLVSSRLVSSRPRACAISSGSCGLTSNPVTPSTIASGTPPERPPTTASPHALASRNPYP